MPGLVYMARIAFCVVTTDHMLGFLASMLHAVPEPVPEQVMMSMLVFSDGSESMRSVMPAGSSKLSATSNIAEVAFPSRVIVALPVTARLESGCVAARLFSSVPAAAVS